jgi:TRAP-type C4-dicarboxylate transport system permease large subunit
MRHARSTEPAIIKRVAQAAQDSNDKVMAAVAWGGALMAGPLVPGAVWAVSRQQQGSLALREARFATIVWGIVLAIWVPVVVFGLMIPAFTTEPSEDNAPPVGVLLVGLVLVLVSWTISITRLVRSLRSTTRPAPSSPPAAPTS